MSVVNGQNDQKLKFVLDAVPNGYLVDSQWMRSNSVARQSVHDYLKRGWLERAGHGLYRRPAPLRSRESDLMEWQTAVLSAQWIMNYAIHVGGESALRLGGHSHYVALGPGRRIFLYGAEQPSWLFKLPLDAQLERRSMRLFDGDDFCVEPERANLEAFSGTDSAAWPLRASTPERAILEALDELPKTASFHVLDMAFQGLANLRPKRLSKLLSLCTSVKVKRLFFVFAERHGHAWLRHVDRSGIDLGKGDRELVKGGKMHKAYRITVPAELLAGGAHGE